MFEYFKFRMISYHLARVQVYVEFIHDEVYIHVKSYKLMKYPAEDLFKVDCWEFKIELLLMQ